MSIRVNGQIVASSAGTTDFNDSPYVTNCITTIPQNIKYELNNGVFTLKAGSKIYAPNGFKENSVLPKFDVITIENDITHPGATTNTEEGVLDLVFDRTTLKPIRMGSTVVAGNVSGSVHPSSGLFYNLTTNKIDFYSNGSLSRVGSFPIGLFKYSTTSQGSGYIVSVKQIFNGFGFIGSTIFGLPGVIGLQPAGNNNNGSLKNVMRQFQDVVIITSTTNSTGQLACDDTSFELVVDKIDYDSKSNWNLTPSGEKFERYCAGRYEITNGKVSLLDVKHAVQYVDYNDLDDMEARLREEIDIVDYDVNTNFVTLNTAQTIKGSKTIANGVIGKNGGTYSTDHSVDQTYFHLTMRDSANKATGNFGSYTSTNGNTSTYINAYHPNDNTKNGNISVMVDDNGVAKTSCTKPTDTTSTGSQQIATVGWVNSAGNNVVHLSGSETISGTKTFTSTPTINGGNGNGQLTLKNNVTTYGTSAVDLVAATSNSMNQFLIHFQEGNKWVGNWSQDPTTKNVTFSVGGCSASYAPTPTETTSTTSNQIATVGWVNSNVNSTVHLGGSETITGVKTFSPSSNVFNISFKNTEVATNATTPTAEKVRGISFNANDGSALGYVYSSVNPSGSNITYVMSRKKVNGTDKSNYFAVQVLADGTLKTTANTPSSATANDGQVATTAWVNNRLSAMSEVKVVISSYVNGTEWYRVWSDGFIEQGGSEISIVSGGTVITFMKAFKDTNYTIVVSATKTGAAQSSFTTCFFNKSNTGGTISGSAVGIIASFYACGY